MSLFAPRSLSPFVFVVVLGLVLGAHTALGVSPALAAEAGTAAKAAGAGKAAAVEPESRVDALLKRLTLEEKLALVGGTDNFYVRGNERLHVPRLRMADGPLGVRNAGPSTGYAGGIALAASWDPLLAGRIGTFIGRDARARGVQIMLGPGVNIYRAPLCGRNFEYFGEDPFLASRMTVAYIKGVQSQGVSATVKHFLANDSEFDRHGTNAVIDERTMREIYLPPFEAAVREAHVGAVMASYNLINGQHASQNVPLNVDLLKKEWGFDGVLMSDWFSVYDGVAAANAGLDLEMPEGEFMSPAVLAEALRTGKLGLGDLDDKVRRILRLTARFGWLDRDPQEPDLSWSLFSQEGRKLALDSARASMVLLKNEHGLLPLDDQKVKRLAVIGPDAFPALPAGGGSAQTRPFQAVSFLEGLSTRLAGKAQMTYRRGLPTWEELFAKSVWRTEQPSEQTNSERGLKAEYFAGRDFAGPVLTSRVDDHVDFSWAKGVEAPAGQKEFSARWTGFFVPEKTGDYRFVATTYGLDTYQLSVDGKVVLDRSQAMQPLGVKVLHLAAKKPVAIKLEYRHHDHHARIALGVRALDAFIDPDAARLAAQADVAVVFAGFDPSTEGEGADRTFALPLDQADLIARVRAANPRTVVVLTSGGGVDTQPWLEKIPALLATWYAGQEGGTALAELLFGDVNPSGKLPVTFERRFEDNAVFKSYYPQKTDTKGDPKGNTKGNTDGHTVTYDEGLFVGYRHFDKHNIKPLFPFGFGLSYTTFKLDHLSVLPAKMVGDGPVTVSCEITNTGARAGAEVAEIYLSEAGAKVVRPVKELKGFVKVTLAPGETQRVSVTLDRRALSTFDVPSKSWKARPGTFKVLVGPSSRDLRLFGELVLE